MPKNGTKTVEPKDLYDTLTQADQDLFDKIGALGYAPEQGATGLWLAKRRTGGVSLGPSLTLNALLDRVKEDADEESAFNGRSEEQFPTRNGDEPDSPAGDGYLFPGMKPTQQQAYPELVTAILNYESYKRERQDALAKEVEAKTEVIGLMHSNKDALAFDPKTGIRSYRVNDYIEELVPGEEKLKTRKVSDDDED